MPAYLFVIAYIVDWTIGDPEWLPHPVRLMGLVIKIGEDFARKLVNGRVSEFVRGMLLTFVVVAGAFTASHYLLQYSIILNAFAGKVLLVYLAATTMAT